MSPVCHSPRYCDDSPHSTTELSECLRVSELSVEGATTGVNAHLGDHGQRLLLAVLEATYEHEQVLLLIDERLAETLRLEVAAVQPMKLAKRRSLSTCDSAPWGVRLKRGRLGMLCKTEGGKTGVFCVRLKGEDWGVLCQTEGGILGCSM